MNVAIYFFFITFFASFYELTLNKLLVFTEFSLNLSTYIGKGCHIFFISKHIYSPRIWSNPFILKMDRV